jgi:hypothetical protein
VLRRIENGVLTVLDLAADDYPRVRELCTQYGTGRSATSTPLLREGGAGCAVATRNQPVRRREVWLTRAQLDSSPGRGGFA